MISSPGQSLDALIRENHIAFNHGEYDPESAEGQHVLAHELAHVRQQTGGAVSMLPQRELALEIDPDPALEREAEETAERVMKGGELGIERLQNTDVHVQRLKPDHLFTGLALFDIENEEENPGMFQQMQNESRKWWIEEHVLDDIGLAFDSKEKQQEIEELNEDIDRFEENTEFPADTLEGLGLYDPDTEDVDEVKEKYQHRADMLREQLDELPDKSDFEQVEKQAGDDAADKLRQVGLTEEQRDRLEEGGVDLSLAGDSMVTVATGLFGKAAKLAGVEMPFIGIVAGLLADVLVHKWGEFDGGVAERIDQAAEEIKREHLGEMADEWDEKATKVDQQRRDQSSESQGVVEERR